MTKTVDEGVLLGRPKDLLVRHLLPKRRKQEIGGTSAAADRWLPRSGNDNCFFSDLSFLRLGVVELATGTHALSRLDGYVLSGHWLAGYLEGQFAI